MSEITTYVPKRDILGRFRPSKRSIYKSLFVLTVVSSLALNWYLFRANYAVRCALPGTSTTIGGYLMKQSTCDQIVTDHFAGLEQAREQAINQLNNQ